MKSEGQQRETGLRSKACKVFNSAPINLWHITRLVRTLNIGLFNCLDDKMVTGRGKTNPASKKCGPLKRTLNYVSRTTQICQTADDTKHELCSNSA